MIAIYLASFVEIFFNILSFLIVVRALLSWFPGRPHNVLFDFIYDVTTPIYDFVRKIVPPIGMIDLSPVVLIFAFYILKVLIFAFLRFL